MLRKIDILRNRLRRARLRKRSVELEIECLKAEIAKHENLMSYYKYGKEEAVLDICKYTIKV